MHWTVGKVKITKAFPSCAQQQLFQLGQVTSKMWRLRIELTNRSQVLACPGRSIIDLGINQPL